MINLLPSDYRKQLAAARTNTLLLRYVMLLGAFIAVLLLEIGVVYLFLNAEKARNEATIADSAARTRGFEPIRKEAEQFKSDLATAKHILGKQVPYSELILAIANNLPTNVVIDTLTIDPTTFGSPSTLNVHTGSYEEAIAARSALSAMKFGEEPIFTEVSFQSVSMDGNDDKHPATAIYQVTFSKRLLAQ